MRAARLAPLVLLAAACGETAPAPSPGEQPSGPELAPVVAEAIAALEQQLEAAAPEPQVYAGDDLEERVTGLVESLGASQPADSMRRLVLEELAQLGDPALEPLGRILADRERPPEMRGAAAEALAAIDSPAAAELLLARVESSRGAVDPEPWIVRQSAWRLGETRQDWVVPRLLLCLRYESDHEAVLWIASTLAHFGNYSGVDPLLVVASDGAEEVRPRAVSLLQSLVADAGLADWSELRDAWHGLPGTSLDQPPPSARHRLEIWRRIRALSEWQLRGVDDGRFVLSREGAPAADYLALALGDEDRYIRVHAAQCLERMGPRGVRAGPALVAALDDPEVAHQAAPALGGLRYAAAVGPLIARLAPAHPLELRVAAARALGMLEDQAIAPALRPLLAETQPLDLRATAAGSLARTGPLDEVEDALALLAELLESPALEPTEIEAALEAWLARQDPAELSEAWFALEAEPAAERLASRRELLRAHLRGG